MQMTDSDYMKTMKSCIQELLSRPVKFHLVFTMVEELVVITGVNGFIGFATFRTALEAGYRVRATVRRQELIDKLKSMKSIKQHLQKIEFVIVKDIADPTAFHGLLDGADYAINIASPLPGKSEDATSLAALKANAVDPAVNSTLAMLQEASKTQTIKRVVVTSSIAAISPFSNMFVEPTDKTYTHESRVLDAAFSNELDAYFASKSEALNKSLEYMDSVKPHFDLVNIMPGGVIGAHEFAETIEQLAVPINVVPLGEMLGKAAFPPFAMTGVHIQDVADIHVGALNPKIPGNRGYILMMDGSCATSWSETNGIVQELFPESVKDGTFPLNGGQQNWAIKFEASDVEEIFDFKYRSYKEMVKSLVTQYLKLLASDPAKGKDGFRLNMETVS
jgi:nucleoside-diphosphate-sugar epimerase